MATFQAIILKGGVHVKQDNTTNIKIRITHRRKTEYISTDLFVHHQKFAHGQATGGGKSNFFLNSRIRDEIKKYSDRYLKLGSLTDRLNVKELKQRLLDDSDYDEIDFLAFADNYRKELLKQGRDGSARGLVGVISNLKKYQDSIKFYDIDTKFLNDFVVFLKKKGVKNGIDNYMREFRLLFKAGIDHYNDEDRGIIRIPHYPFRKFKFKSPERKTFENSFTVEQLKEFINYKPEREREQMAKDMFLLMFYLIGINSKDLFNLGKVDRSGRINYRRAKTGRKYSVKMEPEALEIIRWYKGDKLLINASERYGNHLDWQKYINIELKTIGKSIEKKLKEKDPKATYPVTISTNWARHTWATIARNDCRINKDDVALCLGHKDSDNRVTDIYIRYDYSIIDESNRKVIDAIK